MSMLSTSKAELHRLVDALPEREATVAKRFLEFLLDSVDDPVLQVFLSAPEVEEFLSIEDIDAIEEAERDIMQGMTQPLDEVMKELGQ
jgi:hypothetical protein